MKLTAYIYVALCLLIVGFQIALALGAPWGHLTQGGFNEGTLPVKNRAIAALSVVILLILATTIWRAVQTETIKNWKRWTIFAYSVLGVIANAATPSMAERILWLPVTIAMLACVSVIFKMLANSTNA